MITFTLQHIYNNFINHDSNSYVTFQTGTHRGLKTSLCSFITNTNTNTRNRCDLMMSLKFLCYCFSGYCLIANNGIQVWIALREKDVINVRSRFEFLVACLALKSFHFIVYS